MTRPMPDAIATARLCLELLEPRHGRAVEAYARLREVARYTAEVPHPYPPGGGIAFAESVAHERRHGGGWVWVAVEKAGGEVVGSIGLDLADDRRSAELGYIFAPWRWGRGYATEAARAVIAFAFAIAPPSGDAAGKLLCMGSFRENARMHPGMLGLDAIRSHAAVANRASCRVLAKAGLRRIGNVVFAVPPERGGSMIGEAYRLTRREWQG